MLVRKSVLHGVSCAMSAAANHTGRLHGRLSGGGPGELQGDAGGGHDAACCHRPAGLGSPVVTGADGPGMPGVAGPYVPGGPGWPGGPGHLWLLACFKLVARHIILLREQDTPLAYEVRHELAHVFDNVTVTMELKRAVLCYLSDTVFLYVTGYDA